MSEVLDQQRLAREALATTLTELAAHTPEQLIRTEQLGSTLDFRGGVEVFTQTLALFQGLRNANLDGIPTEVLNELHELAVLALASFKQILDFDSGSQPNPASARDLLIHEIASRYVKQFRQVSPLIAYSVRKGTDFERLEREARIALEEVGRLRADLEKRSAAIVAEAQSTLAQVQRAAAEVGVAQHAIHFRNEAGQHLRRSKWWLAATALLGIGALIYGLWCLVFLRAEGPSLTVAQSLQLAVTKILVFSVLYFAVIWSGRIYKAQWHNHVVNQHRQNALSTFETFVKAASDEQTKNAVLLQATQSIFSPQSTGFVTQDGDSTGTPQILEIVRSMASPRSPGSGQAG